MNERLRFPTQSESVAVTLFNPKTTALCFDRLVDISGVLPDSIAFDPFVDENASTVVERSADLEFIFDGNSVDFTVLEKGSTKRYENISIDNALALSGNNMIRMVCDVLKQDLRLRAYPVYQSLNAFNKEYEPGNYSVIVSTLSNLQIVLEDELSWAQVIEFRTDKKARISYRRLVHWLDKEMVGKSQSFIEDEIFLRLEDYNEAIQKHGIKTGIGTFLSILDEKFLASASAISGALFLAGVPELAILGGAGLVVGNTLLKIAENAYDVHEEFDEQKKDIAFIFEVQKELKKH
ncbi:MAG: hypothetical protein AB4057_10765 [Crocosphaera sp.]